MLNVAGAKTYSNREALDELARLAAATSTDHAIVEIGVFRGGSLRTMAESTTAPVYGIDAWGMDDLYQGDSGESGGKYDGDQDMETARKLTEHLDNVTLVRDYSSCAAANYDGPPIGTLYIDAEHTYEAALADYRAWKQHLAPNAVVAFDDYTETFPGVKRAVDEIVATDNLAALKVHGGRLAVTRKQ